jgi:hypothetical protein
MIAKNKIPPIERDAEFIGRVMALLDEYHSRFKRGDGLIFLSPSLDMIFDSPDLDIPADLLLRLEDRLVRGQIAPIEPSFNNHHPHWNFLLAAKDKLFCLTIVRKEEHVNLQFKVQLFCLADGMSKPCFVHKDW